MDHPHYDVIIVGAGISSLCAAAQLSFHGRSVLIIERHMRVGGNCCSWQRQVAGYDRPFTFDCGVQDISGLGPSGPLRKLFQTVKAETRIRWQRVQHLYWRNGISVAGGRDEADFIASLCRQFPEDSSGIRALFRDIAAIYGEIYSADMAYPQAARGMSEWVRQRPNTARWLKRPFAEMVASHIKNLDAQAILRIISEYVTENSERPFVEEMAPLYGYYFFGGHYPEGGAQTLPDTLAEICAEQGAEFLMGAAVAKVLLENGEVCGVQTADGRRFSAPIVIGSRDGFINFLQASTTGLVPQRYGTRMRRMSPGPSTIIVSVGLSGRMPLPARIFIQHQSLSFGVGNPSVIDPSLAPENCSAVTILQLMAEEQAASWLDKSAPDYANRKSAAAEALFDAIEASVYPGFRKAIIYKEITTPANFVSYTAARNGNIYGAACASWRPGPKSPIPGLWLIGAATETGPGVEAVALSGLKAANHILAGTETQTRHTALAQ